jgi:adenylate cyclase
LEGQKKLKEKEIHTYATGLDLYRKQFFDQAEKLFSELRTQFPDRKLYAIYQERCHFFINNPPGVTWDGVFSHTSK